MSSRTEQKAKAREARLEAEQHAEQARTRRRRQIVLGGVALAAAVVALVAVLATATGDGDEGSSTDRVTLFDGIPQSGPWLGAQDAPVVVEEFADLQCPFCAQFAKEDLPRIVSDYVRPGQVRMRLRVLTFLGEDSVEAGRMTAAAGLQDKQWTFADAFYAAQGPENSGYVTEDFLRDAAERAGLDVDEALQQRGDPAVARQLSEAQAAADAAGLDSTPSFRVGRRGGEMRTVTSAELPQAIDAALAAR